MTISFTIGDFVNFSGMQYILSFWKNDMEFWVPALQAFFMKQKSNWYKSNLLRRHNLILNRYDKFLKNTVFEGRREDSTSKYLCYCSVKIHEVAQVKILFLELKNSLEFSGIFVLFSLPSPCLFLFLTCLLNSHLLCGILLQVGDKNIYWALV